MLNILRNFASANENIFSTCNVNTVFSSVNIIITAQI